MTLTISPGQRSGAVEIPSSKSQAHRQLICAALGGSGCGIKCRGISGDILSTVSCLRALGAEISIDGYLISVLPIAEVPRGRLSLECKESGSTLRFLLPVCGALGAEADFIMSGRLPDRPMAPFESELEKHALSISRAGNILSCRGKLESGDFSLPGDISSQFISGLLFALPLCSGESRIEISGRRESVPYIKMTEKVLRKSGIVFSSDESGYRICGIQKYSPPASVVLEGDWSNAAFFLCAGAVSDSGITVSGLKAESVQGDTAVLGCLRRFGAEVLVSENSVTVKRGNLCGTDIDASQSPDLVPALGMLACAADGTTRIYNAGRLRFKESDRLSGAAELITALGGSAEQRGGELIINGTGSLRGGVAESRSDHRIAMVAALAACICTEPVELRSCECVGKSYPEFFKDFGSLDTGGRK